MGSQIQSPQRCRCRVAVSSRRVGATRSAQRHQVQQRFAGLGAQRKARRFRPSLQPAQIIMVDWVRELHAIGSLMDAADRNLGGQYVEAEMDRALKLGLLCSNPHPESRLGMRQVLQILEEESPIPGFDAPFYLEMSSPSSTSKSLPDYSGSSEASISKSLDAR